VFREVEHGRMAYIGSVQTIQDVWAGEAIGCGFGQAARNEFVENCG